MSVIQPGYSTGSLLTASSTASSSTVNVTETAPTLSASWPTRLAPIITLDTLGRCSSQPSASCATDTFFVTAHADAALAAGVFHFNEISIPTLKQFLKTHFIPIR